MAGLLPDPLGKLKRSPRHSSRSWCHGREHSLAHLGALSGEEEGVEVNGRGGDEWEGLLLNLPSPESTSSGQNASLTARLRPDPVAGLNPWSPMPIWLTRSTKGVTNDLLPISKFLDHIWTYFLRLPQFSGSNNSMGILRLLSGVTGSQKFKMASVQKEIIMYQVTDEITTEVQQLYPCFRCPTTQWLYG